MKKLVSILCAGAMRLSLAACGAKADISNAANLVDVVTYYGPAMLFPVVSMPKAHGDRIPVKTTRSIRKTL